MSPVDLNAELARAVRFARALPPPVLLGFAELGYRRHLVQWGFARVDYYGHERRLYEPQDDGRVMAFVVPVVEVDELVDLAAIDPDTQHVGTRMGFGRGLGLQAIDKARMGYHVGLMERPLDWLRDPVDTAYLFDLAEVRVAFDKVAEFTCATMALTDRVRSLLPPSDRKRVLGPS